MTAPMLEALGLAKTFHASGREVRAVRGVSFAIDEGEIYALVGLNGAGKSTTVHMLVTLVEPTSGTATVGGHDILRDPDAVRGTIGAALQSTGLDESHTGRELLELHGRLSGLDQRAASSRADELLGLVTLGDAGERRIGTYSGGMKRQVDLALSLVARPRVVFLDEPTAGLDPISRRQLWEEIRSLKGHGITVLLTTQYLEEADELADRVGILAEGALIAEGSPDELKRRIGGDIVEARLRDHAAARTLAAHLGEEAQADGDSIRVKAPDGAARVPRLLEQAQQVEVAILELRVARPTLDDAFIALAQAYSRVDAAGERDEARVA